MRKICFLLQKFIGKQWRQKPLCSLTYLDKCLSKPHYPWGLGTMALLLSPVGKLEQVWEMEMLLQKKKKERKNKLKTFRAIPVPSNMLAGERNRMPGKSSGLGVLKNSFKSAPGEEWGNCDFPQEKKKQPHPDLGKRKSLCVCIGETPHRREALSP